MSKLTAELIAQTALKIVDEEGIAALSMRRLGDELQANAKAVYYYFPNKDALIAGVLQVAFAEMDLPAQFDGSWKEQLRQIAYRYSQWVNTHPNLLSYLMRFDGSVPIVFEIVERIIAALVETGLSARSVGQIVDLFSTFVPSFALSNQHTGSRNDLSYQQLLTVSAAQFPQTRQLLQQLTPGDLDEDFDLQMEIVLLGIEALIEREQKPNR